METLKNWPLLVCTAALLAGCATAQLDKGLKGLVGQNIDQAVKRLGYPTSERTTLGTKIYTWSTSFGGVIPSATSANTVGVVPVNYACKVELIVDAAGTITDYDWEGDQGGCEGFADRVAR